MSLKQLSKHKIIGLDLDQTIINGFTSHKLQKFILDTYHKKEFHIITFRTKNFPHVWPDVSKHSNNLLNKDMFKEAHGPLTRDMENHDLLSFLAQYHKEYDIKKLERKVKKDLYNRNLNFNEVVKSYETILEFKGKKAKELGCTVLVDDLDHMVLPGCQAHSIEFIHSYDL